MNDDKKDCSPVTGAAVAGEVECPMDVCRSVTSAFLRYDAVRRRTAIKFAGKEEKNEPGNDKSPSSILGNNSRETPYIPRADSHSNPGKDNSPSRSECFSDLHVAPTLLFRNFSVND